MMDAVVLYILILFWLTLTLIQGHRSVRKQKLLRELSKKKKKKKSVDLNRIWYTVET